jgi:hypothetical protein
MAGETTGRPVPFAGPSFVFRLEIFEAALDAQGKRI